MEWLSHNLGVVVSMLAMAAAIVAGWAVNAYRIGRLERDKETANQRTHDLESALSAHAGNTTLHIDPHRDKAIWEEFKREMIANFASVVQRFDSTDRKIERIITLLPGRPEV